MAEPSKPAGDHTSLTHIAGAPAATPPPAGDPDATRMTAISGGATRDPDAPTSGRSLESLIGQTLGGCRIEKMLGAGGMGAVFQAMQLSLDRTIALKVLLPEHSGDPQFADRFVREAKLAAALSHPHVVAVYDAGRDVAQGGMLFLVMEFVPGHTLGGVLDRQGALPPALACAVFRQACSGLAAAHRRGLVHRDIKPDNLMISEDGLVKVMDFGLARPAKRGRADLTVSGMILGTPNYISPEAAGGKPADIRADLYSLGVTLWEMLAGRVPFTAPTPVQVMAKHLEAPPPDLAVVAKVPRPLADFVTRCLAKDPAQRFDDPDHCIAALDAVAVSLTGPLPGLGWQNERLVVAGSAPATFVRGAGGRRRGSRRWPYAFAGVLAVVMAGWWLRPSAPPVVIPVLPTPPVAPVVPAGPMPEAVRPADGAALVGMLKYEWKAVADPAATYEIERSASDGGSATRRLTGLSLVEDELAGRGALRWRLRVHLGAGSAARSGPWTPWRAVAHDRSSYDRLLRTRTIHVGIAEEDGILVRLQDGRLTGFEIDLLRELCQSILAEAGVPVETVEVRWTATQWGDAFFSALNDRTEVDLLAACISITRAREEKYRLRFTTPSLTFPSALLSRPGEPVFTDGMLALRRLGAAANTTNAELARRLIGAEAATRLTEQAGSKVHYDLIERMLQGELDGVILDLPFALKAARAFTAQGRPLALTAIDKTRHPAAGEEAIGYALRFSDDKLRTALDAAMVRLDARRRALQRQYLPLPGQ